MAEVVFEMVSVLLEDVEGFVLDFPPGAGALGQFDDIVALDVEAGDEVSAVGDGFVRSLAGDLVSVDAQGVVAVPQGQVCHPVVTKGAPPDSGPGGGLADMETDAIEVFVEGLVAVRHRGHRRGRPF